MNYDWKFAVGNADLAEWLTFALYVLAGGLSARATQIARLNVESWEQKFWCFAVFVLIVLGSNELLDLHPLLTSIGRDYAQSSGWYAKRRNYQFLFVLGLAAVALVCGSFMLWSTRHKKGTVRLAAVGLVFMLVFIVTRSASVHHLDKILDYGVGFLNWGSLQEMIGVSIFCVAASKYIHDQAVRLNKERSSSKL